MSEENSSRYDDNIEDLMSPEEIEAMNAPDDDFTEDELAEIVDEDNEPEPEPQPEPEPEPELEAKTKANEPEPELETDLEPELEPVDEEENLTVYEAKVPEEWQGLSDKLDQQERDLKAKFRDGELEVEEYDEARDKINNMRRDLDKQIIKAELSEEINTQARHRAWVDNVNKFLDKSKNEIDYRNDQTKLNQLDQFYKVISSTEGNEKKGRSWALAEAHKAVKALYGIQTQETNNNAPPSRKPPLGKAPANLSQVPGNDGVGDVDSEFSHVDQLEGFEAEDAVARMTEDQRRRYAQAR